MTMASAEYLALARAIDCTNYHFDRCIAVAGGERCGLFLHKLLRWHRYTKVTRNGYKWVTLTRAEWQAELHCTPKQIRLVLEKMTALDFIVREQHFFSGNKPSLFVQPTGTLFLALTGEGPTQAGPPGPSQDGPLGPSLYVNLHSKL
ncbi:hypothetical protein [Reyranella sp.]|uniref:hypothetical protein n=1 Tax=Reyranella sp. TaxID=1929291 RepID=UPI001217EAE3|nr:hypothetical protein [Reyranella sp.]TAJ90004.1 MAG: hypothetical protein EPO50_06570 [Reyranella sp.]